GDWAVTVVQTCALPISSHASCRVPFEVVAKRRAARPELHRLAETILAPVYAEPKRLRMEGPRRPPDRQATVRQSSRQGPTMGWRSEERRVGERGRWVVG